MLQLRGHQLPLGQTSIETKVFETKNAIAIGATEIDYVINLTESKLKIGIFEAEMEQIVAIAGKNKSFKGDF